MQLQGSILRHNFCPDKITFSKEELLAMQREWLEDENKIDLNDFLTEAIKTIINGG